MKLWPGRNWRSLTRLGVLAALIVAVLVSVAVFEIRDFAPGPAVQALTGVVLARNFEGLAHLQPSSDPRTVKLRAAYFSTVIDQMAVVTACRAYWEKNGSVPSGPEDLLKAGIKPSYQLDPWGRPFKIRLLAGNFLLVQSTGPSGQDEVPLTYLSQPRESFQGGPKLVGDNLVIGLQLP
jgi:hypothetical protein